MKHPKRPSNTPKHLRFRWLILVPMGFIFCILGVAFSILMAFYIQLERSLPSGQSLRNYHPPTVSTMYAADGSLIGEFYAERRYLVPLEKIPPYIIQAFLAAEDARFYQHEGVDLPGIIRAFFKNVQAGEIVQGGSTITQQVIKSLLLTPERTWKRKIKEAILARRIDHWLSKDKILYLYLNQIYLGSGAYGLEAAARTYFGKHVAHLSLSEGALLAGLPKAPGRYSPFRNPDRARERQLYVLNRMVEEGFISEEEAQKAFADPLRLIPPKRWTLKELNFFSEEVRRRVEGRHGYDILYKEGIKIHTTMDPRAQAIAEKALLEGLRQYDKRHGYRGPHRRVSKGNQPDFLKSLKEKNQKAKEGDIVEALVIVRKPQSNAYSLDLGSFKGELPSSGRKWAGSRATFRPGDVIWVRLKEWSSDSLWITSLEQEPKVQGSLMAMNPKTGAVLCMVGGRDLEQSQFNRVTQAIRQPGSAFKPIVYAAALDKDFTPASVLVDSVFVYEDGIHGLWKPSNYDGKFWGQLSLRKALIHSRNVVTVKLLEEIGADYVIDYARRLGIRSHLTPTLSLALGASGVSLWELMTAYSVFSNQGKRTSPYLVRRIVDRNGNIMEEHQVQTESVISPQIAFVMTDILKGVIQRGTGRRAKKLERPAAGKTGTTNDFRDAWFIGYTPSVLAGAWVGHDDDSISLGRKEAGGRVALPVWLGFMQEWLKDQPVEDFPVPEGIVFARMNENTGALADPDNPRGVYAAFVEGKIRDNRRVYHHSKSPAKSSVSFFKSDIF
jgi:penicillin-binding protein 1A